jgi:hypothetical protein
MTNNNRRSETSRKENNGVKVGLLDINNKRKKILRKTDAAKDFCGSWFNKEDKRCRKMKLIT